MNTYFFAHLLHNFFHFLIRNFRPIRKYYIRTYLKKGLIMDSSLLEKKLNSMDKVILHHSGFAGKVGLVKDTFNKEFKGYERITDYWQKYERFLKNNEIEYSFFDIRKSTWQNEAKKYDVIICCIDSLPFTLVEIRDKIYFLEKYLHKKCYPKYDEIWFYEDKIKNTVLFNHYGINAIPTFITHSEDEALEFVSTTNYPIISKITTGSASKGVTRINTKAQATRYVRKVFSTKGNATYWQGIYQKNYVYFQKFIQDAEYDLRIIVVGNKFFGYYRYPKKGDFRASGSKIIRMKTLPDEAMRIALKTKLLLNSTILAVDMLYTKETNQYLVIETSSNIYVDTGEELVINNKPGYYELENDRFIFKEGSFWIQELALEEFFKNIMTDKK